jgi:hypothetical protein
MPVISSIAPQTCQANRQSELGVEEQRGRGAEDPASLLRSYAGTRKRRKGAEEKRGRGAGVRGSGGAFGSRVQGAGFKATRPPRKGASSMLTLSPAPCALNPGGWAGNPESSIEHPASARWADPASPYGLRRDKSGFRLRSSNYAVTRKNAGPSGPAERRLASEIGSADQSSGSSRLSS